MRTRFVRVIAAAAMLTAWCDRAPGETSAPKRPNIVFILSDDHATAAIGCYGSRIGKTPQIDRLAAGGMRFEHCFCTESICGPSRAAFMTGKYGHITGAMGWKPYDRQHRTFPEYLHDAGYQTALLGKYHLGPNPPGFDYYDILPGQGKYLDPELISKQGRAQYHGHVSDVLTERALAWLARRDTQRPFLLCLHHKATHMPWQPCPRHQELFANEEIAEPPQMWQSERQAAACRSLSILTIDNLPRWQRPLWGETPTGLSAEQQSRWLYQRYIKDYLRTAVGMDENIGRVLDFLDQQHLADDTLVIYSSDQGFFLGEHRWFDKRWMLEPSLRMPLVVRYPPMIKTRSRCEALVLNIDLAPTLLDLAGVACPTDMQGRSLRPLLAGSPPADWRHSIYYRYYATEYAIPPHYGVRTERYKLIHYLGQAGVDDGSTLAQPKRWQPVDEWELLDLVNDPEERVNLYHRPAYQATVAELQAELKRLRQELKDHD